MHSLLKQQNKIQPFLKSRFLLYHSVSHYSNLNNQAHFGLKHETMDSVVCYGKQDYKYETRKIPIDLHPDEILINVTRVGICAGDPKCYLGAPLFWAPNEFGEPYCQKGVIAGHEEQYHKKPKVPEWNPKIFPKMLGLVTH